MISTPSLTVDSTFQLRLPPVNIVEYPVPLQNVTEQRYIFCNEAELFVGVTTSLPTQSSTLITPIDIRKSAEQIVVQGIQTNPGNFRGEEPVECQTVNEYLVSSSATEVIPIPNFNGITFDPVRNEVKITLDIENPLFLQEYQNKLLEFFIIAKYPE